MFAELWLERARARFEVDNRGEPASKTDGRPGEEVWPEEDGRGAGAWLSRPGRKSAGRARLPGARRGDSWTSLLEALRLGA